MAYIPPNPNGSATSANSAPVVIASDQAAIPITGSQSAASTAAWTSATTVNTALTISTTNLNTVSVTMSNTSTMTAGVLTFEVSPDGGTTWFAIMLARIDSYTVEATYTLNAVANRAWTTSVDAFTNFRVRLSTVITGTGTATIKVAAQLFAIEPIITVGQATAANLNATVAGTVTANGGTPFANPVVTTTTDTGAKTVTVNGATVTNANSKGAQIVLNVGAVTGTTPTLVATVQGSADSGTTWFNIPSATTATLTATGVYGITIYPGLAAVAGVATTQTTAQINAALPRTWRMVYTIGGTTPSFTLTNVQVSYLL